MHHNNKSTYMCNAPLSHTMDHLSLVELTSLGFGVCSNLSVTVYQPGRGVAPACASTCFTNVGSRVFYSTGNSGLIEGGDPCLCLPQDVTVDDLIRCHATLWTPPQLTFPSGVAPYVTMIPIFKSWALVTPPPPSPPSALSPGAIVGIVFGSVGFLLIVFYCCCTSRNGRVRYGAFR